MHNKGENRNSLVVQWLGLGAFTAGGTGSIPGHRTQNLQVVGQKKKNRGNRPLLSTCRNPRGWAVNPVCSGPLPHVEASGFTIAAPKSYWGHVV